VSEVVSFLIEKRYVIAKEERLNNLLLSNTQNCDCLVPRNDVKRSCLFLNKNRDVIAKEKRLKQSFVYRIPIDEIASYLAMALTETGSFLIEKRYVTAKEERLNILLI
jgi:hypothetical protein